ncbi:hypothetical protein SAMN05428944_0514 [Streptomyces sp. 1222.5]|nr:hypothetical protein BX260_7581 [Streptomyces sp. 5112.2]SEB59939.1 hypothetical protein SAMN05428944_0514 [Streptomyces sp. 1222.5]SEE34185.1 hypothetical protein SAMN05216532_7833 [Streptomyces sp. 2231.1]
MTPLRPHGPDSGVSAVGNQPGMIDSVVRGGAAGAAGTTVLNAVTYADMAVRGRPSSRAPAEVAEKIAQDTGHPVAGAGETRDNRLSGLGALSGIAVGCGMGVAVSLMRQAGLRMPWWLGGVVTGGLAMAATDLPMARLGVSDPRTWSAKDWVSDVIPHVVYGLVTYGIVTASDHRT